jgi:hypothetical protein
MFLTFRLHGVGVMFGVKGVHGPVRELSEPGKGWIEGERDTE